VRVAIPEAQKMAPVAVSLGSITQDIVQLKGSKGKQPGIVDELKDILKSPPLQVIMDSSESMQCHCEGARNERKNLD
jgi:hypothetical protein